MLSLCISTAPRQGALTTLAPPLCSKKWWRSGHDSQSWKQFPHVGVFTGPFGEGDSLSTLKAGKLRQGCVVPCRFTCQKSLLPIPSDPLPLPGKVISYNVIPAVSQILRERPWGHDHMGFDFMGTKDKNLLRFVFDSFICV